MRCQQGCSATIAVVAGVLAVVLAPGLGHAQSGNTDRPAAEAEINANDVYVRSGDSLNHYTIMKLKAGDRVRVVGERGEWYEILPPEGAYSLISGDYVDTADDKAGIVNGANVRVRAGSLLNDNKYTVQTLLGKGAQVTILGRNPDGFLRIMPPDGATVWINKQFANLKSPIPAASASPPETAVNSTATSTDPKPATEGAEASDESASASLSESPSPKPVRSQVSLAEAESQRAKLLELDSALNREYAKPADERKLEPFLSDYNRVKADAADEFIQQYAQRRLEEVQTAIEATSSIGHWRKIEEIAEAKRREFRSARAAIPDVPPAAPTIEAKGELRISSLFPPGSDPERYRLIDPATAGERTIAYVEIPDGSNIQVNEFLNKYVGVRALERRVQTGGVNPIPIYIADDLVLLEPPDTQSNARPMP